MPWVWLHATKDYLEMAQHLERHPKMRATINLVPSLIKQIEEYLSGKYSDPVVDLMTKPTISLTANDKQFMLRSFFLASKNVISRSVRYEELYQKAQATADFTDQDFRDLAVHYSLAWTGEFARSEEPIKSLVVRDRDYSEDNKQALMQAQIANVRKILLLHKKLAKRGQVELSTTPFYHPILPLLIDTEVAHESMPYAVLPTTRFQELAEAAKQLIDAKAFFESRIGITPNGMWPSEGSISNAALNLIRKTGLHWAATDEAVLANSTEKSTVSLGALEVAREHRKYFPYRYSTPSGYITLFFRDHRLSDAIGFTYQSEDAQAAVSDFESKILAIREDLVKDYGESILDSACVSVILDGENCWEYYPNNGYDFLGRFYEVLADNELIETTTFSDVVATKSEKPALDSVVAGSWINANFRIWIGHPEDNRAWDLLSQAKAVYDRAVQKSSRLEGADKERLNAALALAHEHLMIAEGSDWCWWYGDDHYSAQKNVFDEIFRTHLRGVYSHLDLTPPAELFRSIMSQVEHSPSTNGHTISDTHSSAMSRSDA
jgi:alpha-amylase/alpha-mannosidase (GH57 family)